MRPNPVRLYTLVLVFSAAILYGTTYQQFRFFDLAAPGGANDATYYVAMSRGNCDIEVHHRYRWLTPAIAGLVRPALEDAVQIKGLSLKLSFYLVNFAFSVGAWLNAKHRYHVIPHIVLATIPIGLGYALLSGNLGRMFLAAFPAVIAYALASIDHVSRASGQGTSAR
jgi:hypothetical protein